MHKNNGNQPGQDPRFAPLNVTDRYYMVCAQWVKLEQPSLIAKLDDDLTAPKPEVIAVRKCENFFINMPVSAFYILNRPKYMEFAVLWALQITRKEYEAAILVMTPEESPSEEEQAAAEAPPLSDAEKQAPDPTAN